MSSQYYPIFIKGDLFHVLVVGGGPVAEGKIRSLLESGAHVTVVSPEITPAIAAYAKENAITYLCERYDARYFPFPLHLIIAATNDNDVHRQIVSDANERGILVNIVDVTEYCSVIMPSVMNKGAVSVAVSTGGAAPLLARKLRLEIEASIPDQYSILIEELALLRPRIKQLPPENRKAFWLTMVLLDKNDLPKEDTAIRQWTLNQLESYEMQTTTLSTGSPLKIGKVYLVGAGPGDPLLLTLRGKQCLEQADVVIYDSLANELLLNYAPNNAVKIYVGKSGSFHTKEQEEINQLIVTHSLAGQTVVRLKGGDPCIFGRGGEECEVLRAHDIPYEIVPGITAGLGATAYAGIPLTHRALASSVALVTGHAMSGTGQPVHWEYLAKGVDTLVFYMGISNVAQIASELLKHGCPSDTPAALIERGTTPQQRTCVTTLASLVETCNTEQITPPGIIIIGEVVRLRDKLQWFK